MNTILWVIISWGMDTRCNWTEKMFRGVSHQCINDPDHFHSNSTDDDVDDDNRIDESAILEPWEQLHHSPSAASIFLQLRFLHFVVECNIQRNA